MGFTDTFLKDIGVDLGTANSLVYLKHRGIVVNEPSIVAINLKTNQILSVGDEAKRMLGRTPSHISVIRPLVSGVISDFDMTQELLRQFLKKVSKGHMFSFRRAILGIQNDLTEVERKSVEDAAMNAGATRVHLVESPVAAALGANLPIDAPTASLIIDIGGGTTDIAVISMGGTVVSRTLRVAGDRFNDDIMRYVRDEYRLAIGESTAEIAKIAVGSAVPLDGRLEIAIRGRDLATGLPREIILKNNHVRTALAKSLHAITDAVKEVIEATPPELAGDMLEHGIYLCGGGALLRGLDQLIEHETQVVTRVVDEPLTCLARGLGMIVENFDRYGELLDNPLKPLNITLT